MYPIRHPGQTLRYHSVPWRPSPYVSHSTNAINSQYLKFNTHYGAVSNKVCILPVARFLGNTIVLWNCIIVWYKCCFYVTMVTWWHNSTIWHHSSSTMAPINRKCTLNIIVIWLSLSAITRQEHKEPTLQRQPEYSCRHSILGHREPEYLIPNATKLSNPGSAYKSPHSNHVTSSKLLDSLIALKGQISIGWH